MLLKSYLLLFLLGVSFALPAEEGAAAVAEESAQGVDEVVDEEPLDETGVEGEEEGAEGEAEEGALEEEDPPEEICEYKDDELGPISITFTETDVGATALAITPDTIENMDDKLTVCLRSDLSGRRTVKGSKRRRKGNKRRKGATKVRSPNQVLRMMRQKVKGKQVSVTEMRQAIKLGKTYLRVMKRRGKAGKKGKKGKKGGKNRG